MRAPLALVVACLTVLACAPAAGAATAVRTAQSDAQAALERSLSAAMHGAGSLSGAYVIDAKSNKALYGSRSTVARILASNTKIFTTSTALDRYGTGSSLATSLLGSGQLHSDGSWRGNLYLRGGGDPTFGSLSFARSSYGSDASVETLAARLRAAGFRSVSGRVFGDESLFDSLRGGPDSNYGISSYVGPLSALDFDRGLTAGGRNYITSPALYSAQRLDAALEAAGIAVHGKPTTGRPPSGSVELAEARSPSIARLVKLTNKDSDNFFAEMLLKGLPAVPRGGGSLRSSSAPLPVTPTPAKPAAAAAPGPPNVAGTTSGGASIARSFAHRVGVHPKLVDGSGLSRSDRATPRDVATMLDRLRDRPLFNAFYGSLPIAGRDGTLRDRMRSGAARGHCRAKTGTLSNVSALSGYCSTRSGRTLVFSILMNGVNPSGARSLQDRMAQALAGYAG